MNRLPTIAYLETHSSDAAAILAAHERAADETLRLGIPDHRGGAYMRRKARKRLQRIASHRAALGIDAG